MAAAATATVGAASSSPIQRAVTGNDAFVVEQEILLKSAAAAGRPRVDTVVRLRGVGELRLVAAATVSDAGGRRIDFAFEEGFFEWASLPLPRIPYPVPFKLLGDEAKGWLDTTYMSDSGLRISRGNKGTTFVLERATA